MIKKLSISIVVIALILGGFAVWFKTRAVVETKEVLGETVESVIEKSGEARSRSARPEKSFSDETINQPKADPASPEKGPYPMEIDIKKSYEAILKTSVGDITISFVASATPITVNNFVVLSRKNFYNNTIFHRVINGFMIQGGDPKGTGSGGPGYQFDDEQFTGEYSRGTIAMANAGPNTNGSQFFIMHKDYGLPKNYVIFGKVTSGIEVVDTIATAPTEPGGEGSTPVSPVKVESIQIVEK